MTLITRPRRFGKTLNMSMLNCFFSNKYADREDLFEALSVWKEDEYRKIQGIYPVLLLSFASVKADNAADARKQIKSRITSLYQDYEYLLESERLSDSEKLAYRRVLTDMADQADIYELRSNRESGFGRYDVMMIPRMECGQNRPAIILEFKVYNSRRETSLEDTVQAALTQIKEKNYDAELLARGIGKENIRHYGFAFEGKQVLIG